MITLSSRGNPSATPRSSVVQRLLRSGAMTQYAVWDLIVVGAMAGLALRWLLSIDIEMHWAALAGAVVMVLQPWATANMGTFVSTGSLPSLFFGGGVVAAIVAVVQSINGR